MIKAIKLVLKEDTILDLYFLDGSVKRYDVLSLADKFPQLEQLKDRQLFLKGRLMGFGGVVFNDELDIGAETIYEEGIDVSVEYDDIEIVVFGYRIKEERLKREMSQEELAARIGIDQADLSKIEKGQANPSYKMMKRIAIGLDKSLILDL